VELPQADAEPLPSEMDEPLVVTVDRNGDMFIDVGEGKNSPVDADALVSRVRTVLKYKPKTPVMVRGDRGVAYGRVIQAMVLLQEGGAPSVGLVTETPES
jgi:biopolymer transport protein TolR